MKCFLPANVIIGNQVSGDSKRDVLTTPFLEQQRIITEEENVWHMWKDNYHLLIGC